MQLTTKTRKDVNLKDIKEAITAGAASRLSARLTSSKSSLWTARP